MRRADKVREQLSKSVQEKYLKQLHLLGNQNVSPAALNSLKVPTQISDMPSEYTKATTASIVPQVSSAVLAIQQQSITEKSNTIAPSLSVATPLPQQDQIPQVPRVVPQLFNINGNPFQIPFDVQLIIAEFIGLVGMAKVAELNHAFNDLKCKFFKLKNRVPTSIEILSFVEKKQLELESLKKQLSELPNQSSCKKNDGKSTKSELCTTPALASSQSESIEIALYWLLIQLSHISTMTARLDILRSIAFVFHDAYLCLQQNYTFSLGAEVDFAIHSIGLRAELAAISNWVSVVGQRTERQHRLLDRFEGFYKMLTNHEARASIASEVFQIVKSFKDNPAFGVNIPPDRNTPSSLCQIEDYHRKIKPYFEKWKKNEAFAKAEHKKQMKAESSSPNCNHSNRGLTHTINEMLPSVFRR